MKNNIIRIVLVLLVISLNIGCDQQTKYMAQDQLLGADTQSYLGDTFRLLYAENDGAFLSMGSGFGETLQFWLLKMLPVSMLVLLLCYTFLSKSLTRYQILGLSFILGGGISNIYDRINFGKVVDFMNMGIGDLRTGIFNFADVSIMVGIAIFLIANWFVKEEPKVVSDPVDLETSGQE